VPEINYNSRILADAVFEGDGFMDRLEKDYQNRRNKSHEITERNNICLRNYVNPQTKKPFFMPDVGRDPLIERNAENMPIGVHLYEQAFLTEQKIMDRQMVTEEAIKAKREKPKTNNISNLIVEGKKHERLERIFQLLDDDDDGIISSSKISINNLPGNVLKIISPLLIEMEEMQLELIFEDFYKAADKLYSVSVFFLFLELIVGV
jgi:hypothetical protein